MKQPFLIAAIMALVLISLSCEGPAGPAGPPGDPNGSMSDPSVMPKVVYSYPGAGTNGPYLELYRYDCGWEWCYYYSQFQVRFNKFMDVTSVRRAVRLTSPYGDIFADTNFIISVGGDVFILNPVDSNGYRAYLRYRVGGTYTIGVDSTARDINGNALVPSFTASFVPEPWFRVMSASPNDGATDVPVNSSISLGFNSRITSEVITHASIEPTIPGFWWFASDSTGIGYQPATYLPTGTVFTVRVDGTAEDAFGNRIPSPYEIRFTTVPFKVVSTSPAGGATGVSLTTAPVTYFSVALDTSTIRQAFRLTPPTPGEIIGVYYGTGAIAFTPFDGLLGSTTYTVRVDSTLRDLEGVALDGGSTWSFTTAPFSVVSTSPLSGATGVSRTNFLNIYTNAPLASGTVQSAVTFSPAFPVSVIYPCDGCTSFYISAVDTLAPNTTYTVTIGTGLRTRRGEPLPVPYSFSFTTGPN